MVKQESKKQESLSPGIWGKERLNQGGIERSAARQTSRRPRRKSIDLPTPNECRAGARPSVSLTTADDFEGVGTRGAAGSV